MRTAIRLAACACLFVLAACGGGSASDPPGSSSSGGSSSGGNNPTPVITSLSPSAATTGGSAFSMLVEGTGFVSGSTVQWGGRALETTYNSSTSLSAQVPAANIVTAGTVQVYVFSPAPGGGTSQPAKFTINGAGSGNPVPAISSLLPGSVNAGGSDFTLTVIGTGFTSESTVQWNGTTLNVGPPTATQINAAVPAALIASAGTAQITVTTPSPGGGTSNTAVFTINGSSSGGGGGGPQLRQSSTYQTIGYGVSVLSPVSTQFNTATNAGDALYVAVTISRFYTQYTLSLSDTQGNTFIQLDQINDLAPGWQTVAHFYAPNIKGDAGTPDTVSLTFGFAGVPNGYEDYVGMVAAEISGVTSAPLVGHRANLQDNLAAGTGNVTSGAISVGSTPALLIGLSMDTSTQSTGPWTPVPAGNLQLRSQLWSFGISYPDAALATESLSATGNASAIFSATGRPSAQDTSGVDDYATVAAVFH